jgi:8-oxo-dGTP pyrophosphatase MutT (NUDIX family)
MDAYQTLSLDDLRERLLPESPDLPLVPSRSDYDLNPAVRPAAPRPLDAAAVLIPIVMREEPTVLFTTRSPHLPRHAGQVSFPGGRSEPTDLSLTETALREMEEEIGISPDFVTVIGYLEPYETVTHFAVLPVVGLVPEDFTVTVDAREVDGVFEVPLAFLLDPASLEEERLEINGQARRVYVFHHGEHRIWGATAAMIVNLRERLL